MADPYDTNLILTLVSFDAYDLFAPVEINWTNFSFHFPLQIGFSDSVDATLDKPERKMLATLGGAYKLPLPDPRQNVSLSFSLGVQAHADEERGENSAYTWHIDNTSFTSAASLRWSSLRRFNWELFGNGASLAALYATAYNNDPTRVEASLNIYVEAPNPALSWFGLSIGAAVVYDHFGMNLYGRNTWFNPSITGYLPTEYKTKGIQNLHWLASAGLSLKLFSLEIQKNFSHLYTNRLYGTLGAKAAYFGRQAEDITRETRISSSASLTLGWEWAFAPIGELLLKVNLVARAAFLFNDIGNQSGHFRPGFSFSVTY
jgi:hypothetical protein